MRSTQTFQEPTKPALPLTYDTWTTFPCFLHQLTNPHLQAWATVQANYLLVGNTVLVGLFWGHVMGDSWGLRHGVVMILCAVLHQFLHGKGNNKKTGEHVLQPKPRALLSKSGMQHWGCDTGRTTGRLKQTWREAPRLLKQNTESRAKEVHVETHPEQYRLHTVHNTHPPLVTFLSQNSSMSFPHFEWDKRAGRVQTADLRLTSPPPPKNISYCTLAKHYNQMEHQGNHVPTSMLQYSLQRAIVPTSYQTPPGQNGHSHILSHVFWVQSCTYWDSITTHGSSTSSNCQMLLHICGADQQQWQSTI